MFARGSGEPQGLGILGAPLARELAAALPGKKVNSYAVVYGAAMSQTTAGAGGTDMTNHVTSVAANCPNTTFVLGGYSQGATVTDIAIGIKSVASASTGKAIPAELASRVAAVVVFGNPLGMMGRTISASSPTYGPKTKEYCNSGDTICGSGRAGGSTGSGSHLSYSTNGSVPAAAKFAASKISGS